MGMASTGIIRAEGNSASSILDNDKFVIQRYGAAATEAFYTPLEATVDEMATYVSGGTLRVRALGQATLSSGTVTVTMATITAAAVIFLTPNDATPGALGVVVTASTNFAIHSSNGSDASVVNYIVYDV